MRKNLVVQSLHLNIILNILKTLLSIIFPLITFPYASRVLQVENLGKVTYTSSIVTYFSLIAALGIGTYAVREGSRFRDDKYKFKKFASEVFSVNIFTTIIAYTLLILILIFSKNLQNYSLLIFIQSLVIIFSTLGVDWINTIYEDYLYITLRSIIIQFILLVLLFILVRTPEDYYKYAWLNVSSNGLICIFNFLYCRRYCRVHFTFNMRFFYHIRYMLVFFANNLAINIYCNSDKTMLGIFLNDYYVGIYAVSSKIYTVIKNIVAAIFVVCLPRLSYHLGNKNESDYKTLLNQITEILTIILFPATVILMLLSKDVIYILSGSEYSSAIPTLQILSIGIIFSIYGGVLSNCINIPLGEEKINLYATAIAASINFILNLILIPLFQHNGAAISTVIAEASVVFICLLKNKKVFNYLDIKSLRPVFFQSLLGTTSFYFVERILVFFNLNGIAYIISLLGIGGILYILILVLLKNKTIERILSIIKYRGFNN